MDFEQQDDIFRNVIICSYSRFRSIRGKYPNKKVMPDAGCPDTWFYYINKDGTVRHYDTATGFLYDHCIGQFTSVMIKTRYAVKA